MRVIPKYKDLLYVRLLGFKYLALVPTSSFRELSDSYQCAWLALGSTFTAVPADDRKMPAYFLLVATSVELRLKYVLSEEMLRQDLSTDEVTAKLKSIKHDIKALAKKVRQIPKFKQMPADIVEDFNKVCKLLAEPNKHSVRIRYPEEIQTDEVDAFPGDTLNAQLNHAWVRFAAACDELAQP